MPKVVNVSITLFVIDIYFKYFNRENGQNDDAVSLLLLAAFKGKMNYKHFFAITLFSTLEFNINSIRYKYVIKCKYLFNNIALYVPSCIFFC